MFSTATNVTRSEPLLPVFSTHEVHFRKKRDTNTLIFLLPTHSSLLLSLLRPVCRSYGQQDLRCLHLLQTVALVPSCKYDKLLATTTQALAMPMSACTKSRLEETLRPLITKLQDQRDKDNESDARPLIALQLKEAVAECLRAWTDDPVEGFVLRKEHVIKGMRLDDLVATPAGVGYLRGYRREDGFCTVVYPWGQGFVRVKDVKKVKQALNNCSRKRTYNECVALEDQQLYEQIKKLLGNLPSRSLSDKRTVKKEADVAAKYDGEGDIEEYKQLLKFLEEEERVDTMVLRKNVEFLHRVQALANKAKERCHLYMPQEPEQKLLRSNTNQHVSSKSGLEGLDTPIQKLAYIEEEQQGQEDKFAEKRKGTVLDESTRLR